MRKKWWFWISVSISAAVIIFFVLLKWSPLISPSAESLSLEDATALIEERYKGGEVLDIKLKNGQYEIEMDRKQILYEVKLDAENGEIISFSKLSNETIASKNEASKQQKSEKNLKNTPPTSENTESDKEATVRITEEEAVQIAFKEIKGEISDIDLETSDDSNYYLVEIETMDEREAVVQIHAITGEVISITWDD